LGASPPTDAGAASDTAGEDFKIGIGAEEERANTGGGLAARALVGGGGAGGAGGGRERGGAGGALGGGAGGAVLCGWAISSSGSIIWRSFDSNSSERV